MDKPWKGRNQNVKSIPIEIRFWEKVDIRGEDECWNWIGSLDTLGRGIIVIKRVNKVSPRIAYQLSYGVDPGEHWVLYTCDNPACVNPKHLYLGTPKNNAQDRRKRHRDIYGRGDNSRYHKLSQLIANQIRQDYIPRKVSAQKLADRFGVSKKCVLNILHNRTWKHI